MLSSCYVISFARLPTDLPYLLQSHWHTPDLTAAYSYRNSLSYTGYRYKWYTPVLYWLPE